MRQFASCLIVPSDRAASHELPQGLGDAWGKKYVQRLRPSKAILWWPTQQPEGDKDQKRGTSPPSVKWSVKKMSGSYCPCTTKEPDPIADAGAVAVTVALTTLPAKRYWHHTSWGSIRPTEACSPHTADEEVDLVLNCSTSAWRFVGFGGREVFAHAACTDHTHSAIVSTTNSFVTSSFGNPCRECFQPSYCKNVFHIAKSICEKYRCSFSSINYQKINNTINILSTSTTECLFQEILAWSRTFTVLFHSFIAVNWLALEFTLWAAWSLPLARKDWLIKEM